MSDRNLPDWLEGFLQFTFNTEPPMLFRLWTGISVVASAMQRKCALKIGSLEYYPNMYIVLVGPSGSRKGTAMTPGLRIMKQVSGIKIAANAVTREALIRELKMANENIIDVVKGSFEGMHASLTVFSKELTVFLGYANPELMSDLTDWYDCDDDWEYKTKTQGIDTIKGVWVNLIGATTPDLVQTALPLDAIGGGLTSRIIFVFEPHKDKIVHFPYYTKEELILQEQLTFDLERIQQMRGDFKLTDDFIDVYTPWREHQESHPPIEGRRFAGYLEHRPTHAMKLSMIISASRSDSMEITGADLTKSIQILEKTEIKMPNTFLGVGKSGMAEVITHVMTHIALKKELTFGDLMNTFYQDADSWTMNKMVETLESMKFISTGMKGNERIIRYTKKEEKK